jgi:hypothetical protein
MGSVLSLKSRTELWNAKLTCCVVLLSFFECPIEGQAHAVCHAASALHQAYVWFVACTVGRVDCLAFCVGGIIFGQVSTFVLCGGDAVIKEQVVTFAQPLKRPLDVLLPCYFALLAVIFWVKHDSPVVCFV